MFKCSLLNVIRSRFHSWSRTGRRLISASTDNNVSLWDLMTGECEQRFRFPSPVLRVQFHPRREHEILVCPMKHAPVVVNLKDGSHVVCPLEDEVRIEIECGETVRNTGTLKGNCTGSSQCTVAFSHPNSFGPNKYLII